MAAMKSLEALQHLETLAADQWGIITTAQAQREGISRLQINRLAERGILVRARRGVFFLPSAQFGPMTDTREAWISLEPKLFAVERIGSAGKIFVSHESAALIHNIGELIPEKQTFSSMSRKQTSQDDIHIYNNRRVEPGEIENFNGLPVASVERTVADLASENIEFNYLATLVTDALRKEGVRINALSDRLDESASKYRFRSGQELLEACLAEAKSDEDDNENISRFLSVLSADLAVGPKQINRKYSETIDCFNQILGPRDWSKSAVEAVSDSPDFGTRRNESS
ncbi:hypothetical protein GWO62_04160 [Corynebacterium macginleyi]|nr:hypothetical protein [Corynebacterium macginleyi]MBK4152393.1 hypothetical protein [Corynebacterium macginleyi]MBK4157467.1 hypothetical protein [Corynebacterium macginleyi]MBK4161795.1 hypothetical protein [Corynebacterium macginleyi]MBK4168672.1 hypothetical protein [Corynebacterium macginleyi]